MDEATWILCGGLFTACIVAAVGHALWLAGSWIWRILTGTVAPEQGTRCEFCQHPHGVRDGRCGICGSLVYRTEAMKLRADLLATQRQLARWKQSGKLAPEAHQTLHALLINDLPHDGAAAGSTVTSTPASPSPISSPISPLVPAPGTSLASQRTPAKFGEDEFVEAEIVEAEAVGVHPLDRPLETTLVPARTSAPRRALADVLQSFMEQKNIRWVELISGMLVVGGATGLVISLRAALQEIPYFPAISFFLITAALHAAGIYSLRRWNLKTTSRGVLIIATLLVPLSILAAIFLGGEGEQQRAVTDPVFLFAVSVGVLGFGTMNYYASRALVRHGWWRMMLAVLGPSFGALVVNRGQPEQSGAVHAALLMLAPVSAYLVANLASLDRVRRRPQLGRRPVQQFFLELGIGTFALLAPIGLFVTKSNSAADAFRNLSPVLSLAAAVLLATGLFAHRRLTHSQLVAYKTTGTALAILGAGLMLLVVAFAWPQLPLLIAVGVLNFATLSLLATIGDLALLHLLAIACLALAYLAGFHAWRGFPLDNTATASNLARVVFSGISGAALAVFATGAGGVGIGWLRKRRETGLAYLAASGCLGGVCIAIAAYTGFWSGPASGGNWATALFAYFAVAALGAARFTRRSEAAWLGSALILASALHGLKWNSWLRHSLESLESFEWLMHRPVLSAILLHSLSSAGGAGLAAWLAARLERTRNTGRREPLVWPLSWSALATSILAIPFSLWVIEPRFGVHAGYLLCAAPAWLVMFLIFRVPWGWHGFQMLSSMALAYFTTFIASHQSWWNGEPADARHVHLQIILLSASCIPWMVLRRVTAGRRQHFDLPRQESGSVDQSLLVLLGFAVVISAMIGCSPGVWSELAGTARMDDSSTAAALRFLSGGAWLGLATTMIGLGYSLWERRSLSILFVIVLALVAVPLLVAGRFFEMNATASALRWGMAFYAAAWSVPACYFGGRGRSGMGAFRPDLTWLARPADVMRVPSLTIAMLAVVGLTTVVLVRVAAGDPVGTPIAESFFFQIGAAASYVIPLAILVGVLLAYSIGEAKSLYAFAASLVFQYVISLACLLPTLIAGASPDATTWANLLQWNSVGLGAFTLIWLAARRWIEPGSMAARGRMVTLRFLTVQVCLMLMSAASIAIWVTGEVWVGPDHRLAALLELGDWPSYCAVLFAAAAGWWLTREDPHEVGSHLWHGALLLLVPVVAATAHGYDATLQFWAYHVLVLGWLVVAGVATGWMAWRMHAIPLTAGPHRLPAAQIGMVWGTLAAILSGVSGWTNIYDVPPSPLCEAVAACGAIVILGALAVRARVPFHAYASIASAGIAAVLWHSVLPAGHSLKTDAGLVAQFSLSVLAVACVWLGWEVWFQRHGEYGLMPFGTATFVRAPGQAVRMPSNPSHSLRFGSGPVPVFHRFGAAHQVVAGAAMIGALMFVALASLQLIVSDRPVLLSSAESGGFILVLVAFLALQFGSLWDRQGHYATFGLYVWILTTAIFIVVQLPLLESSRRVAWIATLAMQVAVTGWVWSWGGKLAVLGSRIGMADPIESLRRTARWLAIANLILATQVLVISTWIVLNIDARELRVAAACLPLLIAAGVAGMAQQHRRQALQWTALLAASWGLVLLGWSDMVPDWSLPVILARAIRMLMAIIVAGFGLGVIAVRILEEASSWRDSARRVAGILVGSSLLLLLAVLGLEALTYVPGVGAPVETAQIAAVSVMLVALIATLISLAVLPGRDPLSLTERGRMWYVYTAQAVAALLFAHMYLTVPSLFSGTLRPYWPYIVLVIAFAGVGVGTLFDRLGLRVLAEPFQRSGSFLPLVPAIGMWIASSQSSYAAVLFVIGVLYLLLSFTQRSMLAGAAAAIAGNGALWSLLSGQEDLTFGAHPQFWLIPPAASAMIAAQLNRQRLGDAQLATVRYLAMGVIYLSSAVEMLKIGIGESLWPPVILICLSLVGVVFGIAMQVRAYLYLGSIFVLVSIVSMVAHASRRIDHIWPWWAFVIAMGVLILVTFGYFEGRRAQILALIERLRGWEK